MSNETFEALYKKYEAMINSFVRKYKGFLETDEIKQTCLIAIVKAYNTYNCHRDMKFETWVYQNIKWELYREIRNTKHLTKNCVSLESRLIGLEDDNMTLEDILRDDNVDIEAEIENRLMIQTYKREIEKYIIDGKKLDICLLRWFNGCSYEYIKKVTDTNNISGILRESRMTLIRKSSLFHDEYIKICGISDYRTEAVALI